MKWFCNNCDGLIDSDVDQKFYQFSTTCPHCKAPQTKNQSDMADWCQTIAAYHSSSCRLVVEQNKLLKRIDINSPNGVCMGMVAAWIGLYHGALDQKDKILQDFITLYKDKGDYIGARHIEMTQLITVINLNIDDIKIKNSNLTAKMDQKDNVEMAIIDAIPTSHLNPASKEIEEDDQRKQAAFNLFETSQKKLISVLESEIESEREKIKQADLEITNMKEYLKKLMTGKIGIQSSSSHGIVDLNIKLDQILGTAGCYCIGLDENNAEKVNPGGHQIGIISANNFFLLLDPNTGEFLATKSANMKKIILAHMDTVYNNKYTRIEILKVA